MVYTGSIYHLLQKSNPHSLLLRLNYKPATGPLRKLRIKLELGNGREKDVGKRQPALPALD
jgi:hypothetical protein